MKKILFISLVVVLALSVSLIGCEGEEGEEPEPIIKIAVVGPHTDLQGQNHWDGATLAMEEINAAGGVDVGGTMYDVELVKVETEEATEGEDGTTGTANLQAVIDDMTFCVGGFRTEVVTVYREVAMDAGVLFMNCGAATGALQFTVVTDYDDYKYWFKSTPYNETFLVKSLLKMAGTIGNGVFKATLAAADASLDPNYKLSNAVGGNVRVEILMENAAWCAGMIPAANYYLPLIGFNVTGTTLVSPTASDISGDLSTIATRYPHMIFTAFSGSVGAVYSIQKNSLGIPALTLGINVPGQQFSHWANTGGACKGEIMLDTFPIGVNVTDLTEDWVDAFVTRFDRYPVYTAATYDSIKAVVEAIDETNSLDSDVLVDWLEDPANAYTDGVGTPTTAYYQMPDIEIIPDTLYALNESQVEIFYTHLDGGFINPSFAPDTGYDQSHWMAGWYDPGTGPVQQPHIAHDTVYGPGYQTGTGTQWQEVTGAGVKLGVWPIYLGPSYDAPLTDQYGNWNFAYPGTVSPYIDVTAFFP